VSTTPSDEPREQAEARRERLRVLMGRLERVLAEPPQRDLDAWKAGVREVCDEMAEALEDHISETEGPGGFFDEVMRSSPRMGHRVERLRSDHPRLRQGVLDLRDTIDATTSAEEPAWLAREQGVDLLAELVRHRHVGADLVYEAYWVDTGPGD
jgi:hypothetical protein